MPVSFTSHQAASLHECLSSQLWQGLHSPSRAGAYWSLLDPPGCLLEQNSLWHWEGCQVCEEWHQVCTSTSAWPPRNCSPDYLVLPSAWTGQVVINQAEGLVDKELVFGSFRSFRGSGFVQVAGQADTSWLFLSLVLESFLSKPGCNLCLLPSTLCISMLIHLNNGV